MKAKGNAIEATPAVAAELVSIEELFARHNVLAWQMRGDMVARGWAPGKAVTEREFLDALSAWRRSR